MPSLSVVIPALNEVHNLRHVISSVPVAELAELGWETEIVVVDNASTDGTGDVARRLGATVILETNRGYGNAYKAGFAHATGDVIVTGDADQTYPLDHTPRLVATLEAEGIDFLSTNRLLRTNRGAMSPSHEFGNRALSGVSRMLFGGGFVDSQSGMWIFRREIWEHLDVCSSGMPFSQELKNEAFRAGFRCAETPIEYRERGGEVKLNAVRDGIRNLRQLFSHRFRPAPVATAPEPVRRGDSLVLGTFGLGSGKRRPMVPAQRRGGQHEGERRLDPAEIA